MANPPLSAPLALPAVPMALATAMVVLASIGFGSVPFFVRGLTEAGMASQAVALYRYALAAVIFLPFVWQARADRACLAWGIGTGLAMGLGWTGYVAALETLPVATVGVIYMTFPVFALLASWALFGERPTARGLVAAGAVLAGAAVAAGPDALSPAATGALFTALAAPATFGLAIAVLVHRLTPIPVLARIGAISLGSALALLPLVLAAPATSVLPPDRATLLLVIGVSLGTALVPQLLYTLFAPVVGAARASTAGAVELPTMIVIGWLAFAETPGPLQAAGCALIVAAVALSPSRKVRSATATAATARAPERAEEPGPGVSRPPRA
jgi:drug/metabolite transporter (DMT)-like permease